MKILFFIYFHDNNCEGLIFMDINEDLKKYPKH